MKTIRFFAISLMLVFSAGTFAQNVAISDGASAPTPDASAVLDLQSTTRGFLAPRMTQAQREAITWTNGLLVFQTDAPIGYYYLDQVNESWKKIASTTDIQWTTSGSDIYYNSGNVGIGTTPSQKLDVNGIIQSKDGTNSDGNLFLGGQNVSLRSSYVNNVLGIYTNNAERIRINGSGYVGIGTTSPGYPLHVTSFATTPNDPGYYFTGSTSVLTANSGNWNVGIYSVNSILTNGAFVAFSDLRIKENIKEIPHSLDLVRKLRPVSYNKIDKIENGGRTEFGFIAQEVEEILPEAVNTGTGEIPVLKPFDKVEFEAGVNYTILVKNGDNIVEQKYTTKDPRPEGEIIVKSKTVDDFKSLSYDMIFTVAVDAIREQQAQIEAQQGQLEAQQAQLAFQQAQIDALKAQNAVLTQKAESFDQLKVEVEDLKKLVNSNLSQLTINQ